MKNPTQNRINKGLLTAFSAAFLLQAHSFASSQEPAKATPAEIAQTAELRQRAKAGDASAQFELARQWEFGIGMTANLGQAAHWYRLAADQGLARAEHSLGRLYFSGEGVRQDAAEAVKWFRRAAEKGYAPAQNRLARAYELGLGVSQNLSEAYRWYKVAGKTSGLVSSQVNLQALAGRMTKAQLAEAQVRSQTVLVAANDTKMD